MFVSLLRRAAENTLLDLHWVGWQRGFPSRCQDLFDTELVSRLAKVASDAVDLQTEVVPLLKLCCIMLHDVAEGICFKSWRALGVYNVIICHNLVAIVSCVL